MHRQRRDAGFKAARAAGSIINRAALDVAAVRVSQKLSNDFVTEVDHASEEVRNVTSGQLGGLVKKEKISQEQADARLAERIALWRQFCGFHGTSATFVNLA